MKNFLKFGAIAAAITLVVGCGGDSGTPTATTTSPLTGFFIDSAVQGLTYTTATQSGTTPADGSFKYLTGETVTLKLYGLTISSPLGYTYLTPFDLSDSSVDPSYSINLIRFLLAADEDSNPSNGIKLPAFNGTLDINFNQPIRDFEADADGKISSFLIANANGRSLATVQTAVTHFNGSLANINPTYTLSLLGKTITAVTRNTSCTNNVVATAQWTFGASSLQFVGSDGFFNNGDGNCIVNPADDETIPYTSLISGELLDCAPNCNYKQLNRISYIPVDTDGRTKVEWTWHTPNSNVIKNVSTIIADPVNNNQPASLNTFVDVLTIN
jgi:hypothetical protein